MCGSQFTDWPVKAEWFPGIFGPLEEQGAYFKALPTFFFVLVISSTKLGGISHVPHSLFQILSFKSSLVLSQKQWFSPLKVREPHAAVGQDAVSGRKSGVVAVAEAASGSPATATRC